MRHHAVVGGVDGVGRAHCPAWRVGAMRAGHRHRAFTGLAILDGYDASAIDAPRHFVLILARGNARVALDATLGVAEELHFEPWSSLLGALIWQSVTFGSCIPVAGRIRPGM